MAYVVPNSVIQLFKSINLDNRYMHTVYFANEQAQDAAFTAKVFKTFNASQFVRQNATQVKVECDSTELQGVTYLRFKNTRTGTKWYYAFVIGAPQYVNENTSLITFEIDVMQTWFIQAGNVLPCLIKREHSNTDTFAENLEHEPIGSDVYDYDEINNTDYFDEYSVIMSTSADPTAGGSSTDLIKYGLFCGTTLNAYDCNNGTEAGTIANEILNQLGSWDKQQQKADIIDLYTFPTAFVEHWGISVDAPVADILNHVVNQPLNLHGYTPKNKKLFTYPYCFLYGTTKNGDSHIYKWEYWVGTTLGGDATFELLYSPLGGGMVECFPKDYNGIEENIDEALVIDNFPKNSANIDAYQAWVAAGGQTRLNNQSELTRNRNAATIISTTGNAALEIASGTREVIRGAGMMATGVGAASGAVHVTAGLNQYAQATAQALNTYADVTEANNKIAYQWNDVEYVPNIVVGKNTPSLGVSFKTLNFHFINCCVRNDEAKRIDDFFSMYGYATNRIKTPNITGRQYWNFVQTENCQIAGDMPASSKEAIGRIFDGGITFWHNINQIGNYAQSVSSGTVNNPIV